MSAPYSPVRELNLLKEFDDRCDGLFAQWFGLDDFGELYFLADTPELHRGLIGFAAANDSGSTYALWKRDGHTDLATAPVVLLGDGVRIHVIARDVREFLQILGGLEGDLACDWEGVFARDEDELPAQARYHAWLDDTFGLAPAGDPWEVIENAQRELAGEWAEWIFPLVPAAVFSPVHELNLLYEFQKHTPERFAGVYLLPGEDRDDPDGGLFRFAMANTRETFALWWSGDQSDLPIVLVGEEDDGFQVVARNAREFLRLLGALDGVELRLSDGGVDVRDSAPNPSRPEFLAWLDESFGLAPARDALDVVRAARADLRRDDGGTSA